MHDTYGSEGEFIKKSEGKKAMNDNGRITLDTLLKIAQLAVFPVLAGMVWLLVEIFSVKANQIGIAARLDSMPKIAEQVSELAKTVAIIQDRQGRVMAKQETQEIRLDTIDTELSRHRERSTYDPMRPRR